MPLGADTPTKLQRLRDVLREKRLHGAWLRHHANVAWLCDGSRAHIHLASDAGVVSLYVTQSEAIAITHDTEHHRLRDEEGMQHWQFVSLPWTAQGPTQAWSPTASLPQGAALGCDLPLDDAHTSNAPVSQVALHDALLALRTPLLPGEQDRLRRLAHDVSHALYDAACTTRAGCTEHAIAGMAAAAVMSIGAEPVVVLVASDERIARTRHPLPTDKQVAHTAMVVICARRHGLVVSMTRFLAWGQSPTHEALAAKLAQAAYIDACIIRQTRPNTPLSTLWTTVMHAYAHVGQPDAWRGLHQGGACSYAPRDWLLLPELAGRIQAMQAFAWNPSIPGAKSEDTILCTPSGTELLTLGPWPTQAVVIDNDTLLRPALLRLS